VSRKFSRRQVLKSIGTAGVASLVTDVRADELRAMARRILRLATVEDVEQELLAALGRLTHTRE